SPDIIYKHGVMDGLPQRTEKKKTRPSKPALRMKFSELMGNSMFADLVSVAGHNLQARRDGWPAATNGKEENPAIKTCTAN
ncbi:hypothetical protein C0Q16_29270, partial [Klebsiella pneumoniae]